MWFSSELISIIKLQFTPAKDDKSKVSHKTNEAETDEEEEGKKHTHMHM